MIVSNGMNKKYIIGILIVLAVVWTGFSLNKKSAVAPSDPVAENDVVVADGALSAGTSALPGQVTSKTPITRSGTTAAPVMTKSGAYLVSYTNTGFVPATITIKRGKSVHFVNNSNKAMSLTAVDQGSQVYRELNQEQSVGRGGFYDFTFLTAGSWTYTNRNSRTDRGVIVVE